MQVSLLKKIKYWLFSPPLDAVPSFVGYSTNSIEFRANMLHINEEIPKIGDVICSLYEGGCGGIVDRDTRHRVTGYKSNADPYIPNVTYYQVIDQEGNSHSIAYMRKHSIIPRLWLNFI